MHFTNTMRKGNKGEYYMVNCNPAKIPELKKVNMVVCKQTFNWRVEKNGFYQISCLNVVGAFLLHVIVVFTKLN